MIKVIQESPKPKQSLRLWCAFGRISSKPTDYVGTVTHNDSPEAAKELFYRSYRVEPQDIVLVEYP